MDFESPHNAIYVEREGAIGYLKMNRPDKKNALSEAMWTAIPRALDMLEHDTNIRAIIVTSSSQSGFSAGVDIGELEAIAANPGRRESNRQAIRTAQRALARTEKPTIAQVWGACMGGGCGLALHCDMRFAATTARFGITPAKLGLVYPLNDTKQLIDIVGPSRAKSILFTGRTLEAAEALKIGLVDEVYSAGELAGKTKEFVEQVTAVSQFSVRNSKKFIRQILDGQIDDDADTANIFNAAQEGVDAQEGIRAFLEKRSANFSWNGRGGPQKQDS